AAAVLDSAGTSEVALLFLLVYWIFALVIASLAYAAWNRGLRGGVRVVGIESSQGSPVDELPVQILAAGPLVPVFEGDRMQVALEIESKHGTRGPGRIFGSVGGSELSAAAGRVPKEGWTEFRELGPLRRGPVVASGWTTESGDPLGFFRRRGPKVNFELVAVFPRFKALAERQDVGELEGGIAAPSDGAGYDTFDAREYRHGRYRQVWKW